MQIGLSVNARAARIPDPVERLRYIRRAVRRRQAQRVSATTLGGIVAIGLALVVSSPAHTPLAADEAHAQPLVIQLQPEPIKTWVVEQNSSYSLYSNGLQIRADYVTSSTPRQYREISRSLMVSGTRSAPAGIVFHTTESLLIPMLRNENGALVQTREDLLRHVRDNRLYNFVIDRFGQVYRIVPEDQVAYHAGHSVWADEHSVFEGLNESFIGVAFEARTGATPALTPAQLQAGHLLTDMLRTTFDIPESNCVTHAQVSVNPDNMRGGYHTDWAAHFPFRDLGLSTGYQAPIAAVQVFGFVYDDHFLKSIGGDPWPGLVLSSQANLEAAKSQHLSLPAYYSHLQQQYRSIRSRIHEHSSSSYRD